MASLTTIRVIPWSNKRGRWCKAVNSVKSAKSWSNTRKVGWPLLWKKRIKNKPHGAPIQNDPAQLAAWVILAHMPKISPNI